MILLAQVLSALDLAILALVVVNVLTWPRLRPAGGSGRGRATLPGAVSVLIPARDEEGNLDPCLDAVLAQGPVVAEVLVYDDASTDGTAERVRRRADGDDRVRLLAGGPLPAGWCGKPHACARLAEAARGEWLLFLDADARLAPDAVAGLVAEARRRQASLLSAWPGLTMESRAEKLLMPMLNFFVLTLYPAALQLVRREAALGLAHGACLLARRVDYAELGGHARVRDEIFEDTRLARLWRQSGRRGLCLDGQEVVRVRMYASAGEIWRGFRKNLHAGFRRQAAFWAFLAFHAGLFLAPFLLAPALTLAGEAAAAAWAWTAAGAVVAMRLALALRFGHPLGSAWLHPLAEGFLLALGVASWWSARRGGGVEWKGRRYRVGEGEVRRG